MHYTVEIPINLIAGLFQGVGKWVQYSHWHLAQPLKLTVRATLEYNMSHMDLTDKFSV